MCIGVRVLKFEIKLNFFYSFWKKKLLQYHISWKSVQCKPCCSVRSGWRTDRHNEANNRFSQFCERS